MAARKRVCAVLSALWTMAGAGLAGAGLAGEQARMVPHRAVYDLELASAEPRAGLSGATGSAFSRMLRPR